MKSSSKQKLEVLTTIAQIVASFLILLAALLNLSFSDRDKALWSTLAGAGFGYLVPNPSLKCGATEKRDENESVYYDVTEQQLHELRAEQHDGTVRDETD